MSDVTEAAMCVNEHAGTELAIHFINLYDKVFTELAEMPGIDALHFVLGCPRIRMWSLR